MYSLNKIVQNNKKKMLTITRKSARKFSVATIFSFKLKILTAKVNKFCLKIHRTEKKRKKKKVKHFKRKTFLKSKSK